MTGCNMKKISLAPSLWPEQPGRRLTMLSARMVGARRRIFLTRLKKRFLPGWGALHQHSKWTRQWGPVSLAAATMNFYFIRHFSMDQLGLDVPRNQEAPSCQ